MAPVPLAGKVTDVKDLLHAQGDAAQGAGHLAGDEGLSPDGRLVVEEDPVAGVHAVGFPVVNGDPVSKELGHPVGRTRIEGRLFALGNLLHQTVQFARGSLVNAGFANEAQESYGLEEAEDPHSVGIGHIFGRVKAHFYVAHGRKVVDLVGLHLLDDAGEVHRVGEVAVVEHKVAVLHVRILVDMVDTFGVEE